MSEDIKQHVSANSAECKEGLKDRLNSTEDTKNLKAGNVLGQAVNDEDGEKAPVDESLFKKNTIPLFMRGSSDGHQGNAQDEKDGTEE